MGTLNPMRGALSPERLRTAGLCAHTMQCDCKQGQEKARQQKQSNALIYSGLYLGRTGGAVTLPFDSYSTENLKKTYLRGRATFLFRGSQGSQLYLRLIIYLLYFCLISSLRMLTTLDLPVIQLAFLLHLSCLLSTPDNVSLLTLQHIQ